MFNEPLNRFIFLLKVNATEMYQSIDKLIGRNFCIFCSYHLQFILWNRRLFEKDVRIFLNIVGGKVVIRFGLREF